MGKPIRSSRNEIEKSVRLCRYYAEEAERLLADEHILTDAQTGYIRCEPLGPVLAVMPWNFPFWQVIRVAAPAMMAGNVVLLKHASNVPQCALAIENVFQTAGSVGGLFLKGNASYFNFTPWPAKEVVELLEPKGSKIQIDDATDSYYVLRAHNCLAGPPRPSFLLAPLRPAPSNSHELLRQV
jgi:acyl-CoA reductase-like NAD-dependent aldehyde dehydrogenase